MIQHINVVQGINRLIKYDQKLANIFGNLFLKIDHHFDIMPLDGQSFYFMYSVECQEKISISHIINKIERYPKVKGFRVSFDFIDFEKKPCSCYYFIIEKQNKTFEPVEVKEETKKKVNCTNAIEDTETKKEFIELVNKIDCMFIDRNFNDDVSYNVRYGDLETIFMIEISNIYGEVDLRNMFKTVKTHTRTCSSEIKSLIPEISFDCSSRMIIITFIKPTSGTKRPRDGEFLGSVKRQKLLPEENIKLFQGKMYIEQQDGSLKPYKEN